MDVIKFNSLLSDMEPRMQQVAVVTGGYFTEEKTISDQALEHCASAGGPEKVEFYVNQHNQLFSFHFAHRLDLQLAVCAIDFFSEYTFNEVEKVATMVLQAIKQKESSRLEDFK